VREITMDNFFETPFLDTLLAAHPEMKVYPITPPVWEKWDGAKLEIPAVCGADVSSGLYIEDLSGEVTIGFDHTHCHMYWPPPGGRDTDPLEFVKGILGEKIVAATCWKGGKFQVGRLCPYENAKELPSRYSGLQTLRIRSWAGTLDRDEDLGGAAG
jgi:hypothetical protein